MRYAYISFLLAVLLFVIGIIGIIHTRKNKCFRRRIYQGMMVLCMFFLILGTTFIDVNDVIRPYIDDIVSHIAKNDDDNKDKNNDEDGPKDVEYVKLSDFVGDTLGVTKESSKRTMFITAKEEDHIEDILRKNGATNISRFKKNAFHQDECVLLSVFKTEKDMEKAKDELIGYDVTISDDDGDVELSVATENYDFDFKSNDNPIVDTDVPSDSMLLDPNARPYMYTIQLFDTGIDDDDLIGHGTIMRDVIHSEFYYANVQSSNVFNGNPTTTASVMAASLLYGSNGHLGIYNISASGFGHSAALEFAIDKLVNSYNGNVVVAAGNNSDDANNYTPANIDSAITVGAYDKTTGKLADYSNYGSCIDYICDGEFNGTKGTSVAAARMSGYVSCIMNQNIPVENVSDVLDMLSSDVNGYKYVTATETEIVAACNKYKNQVKEQYGIDIDGMFSGIYNEEYGAEYNLYGSDAYYAFYIDKENATLVPASFSNGGARIMHRDVTIFNIPMPYATIDGKGKQLDSDNFDIRLVAFNDYVCNGDYSYNTARQVTPHNTSSDACSFLNNMGDFHRYSYIETHPYKGTEQSELPAIVNFTNFGNEIDISDRTDYAVGNADFKFKPISSITNKKYFYFKYLAYVNNKWITISDKDLIHIRNIGGKLINMVPIIYKEYGTRNLTNLYDYNLFRIDRYAYCKIELNDITIGDASPTFTPYIFAKMNFDTSEENVYDISGVGFDKYLKTDDVIVASNNLDKKIFPMIKRYEIQVDGDKTKESFFVFDSSSEDFVYKANVKSVPKVSLNYISQYLKLKNDRTNVPYKYGVKHYRSSGQALGNNIIGLYEGAGGIPNEVYIYPQTHKIHYAIFKTKSGDDSISNVTVNGETIKTENFSISKALYAFESLVDASSATTEIFKTNSFKYALGKSKSGKSEQLCLYAPKRGGKIKENNADGTREDRYNKTMYNCWTIGFVNKNKDKVIIPTDDNIFIKQKSCTGYKKSIKRIGTSLDAKIEKDINDKRDVSSLRMQIPTEFIRNNCYYFVAILEYDKLKFSYQRTPSKDSAGTSDISNETKQNGLKYVAKQEADDKRPFVIERLNEQQEILDAAYEAALEAYESCLEAKAEAEESGGSGGSSIGNIDDDCGDPPKKPEPAKVTYIKNYNKSHSSIDGYTSDTGFSFPISESNNDDCVWQCLFHQSYGNLLGKMKNFNSTFNDMTYYDAKNNPKSFLHKGRSVTVIYNPNNGSCNTKYITISKGYETNVKGAKAIGGTLDCSEIGGSSDSQVETTADAARYLKNNYNNINNTTSDKVKVFLYLQVNDGTLVLPDAWRDGYIFKGWYKNGTYYGKAGDVKKANAKGGSFTLTAKWEPIKFKVLYVTNIPLDSDPSTATNGIESHSVSSKTGFDKINMNKIKSFRAALDDDDIGGTSTISAYSDADTRYSANWNDKYYSYVGTKTYTYDGTDWELENPDVTVNDMYFTGWTYYDILWDGTHSSYNPKNDTKGTNSNGNDGMFISNVDIGTASELMVLNDGDVITLTSRSDDGNIGTSIGDCYYATEDLRYRTLKMQKNPFANHMNNQPCRESPSKNKGETNADSPNGDRTNCVTDDYFNMYLVLKANWSSKVGNVSVNYNSNNEANVTVTDEWYDMDLTNYKNIYSITDSKFSSTGFGKLYNEYPTSGTNPDETNVRSLDASAIPLANTTSFLSGKYALGDDGSYDGSTTCDQFIVNTSSHAKYYFGKSNGRSGFFSFQGWSPWKYANWRDSIDVTKKDAGAAFTLPNEYQPNGHDNNDTKANTTSKNNGIPVVTRYNDATRSKRVGDLFYRYGVTTLSHDTAYNGGHDNQNSGGSYVSNHTYAMSSKLYNAYHWRWTQGYHGHYSEFINLINQPMLTLYEIWDSYPTTDIQNVYVYTQDGDNNDDDLAMLTPQYLFSKAVVYDYEDFESLGSSRSLGDSSHTWSNNCQPTSGNMNSTEYAGSYSYIYNLSPDTSSLGYVDGRFTATLVNYDYQAFKDAKTAAINNVNAQLEHLKQGGGTANDVQSVALTWKFEDSAGNITYHTSWVYIIDRSSVSVLDKPVSENGDTDDTRYAVTRFIDEKSYIGDGSDSFITSNGISVNDDESTGGVQYRSKWKLNPAYASELTNSLNSLKVIGGSKLTLDDFVRDDDNNGIMDTWGFKVIWSGDYHPQNNGDGTWTYPWEAIKSQCDGVYQLDYNAIVKTKQFVKKEGEWADKGGVANYDVTDHKTLQTYIDEILHKKQSDGKNITIKQMQN